MFRSISEDVANWEVLLGVMGGSDSLTSNNPQPPLTNSKRESTKIFFMCVSFEKKRISDENAAS
ncbi:MAG: hypothetical protein AMXMBFR48_02800 [Ignavibacteriales bacterium]